MVWILETAGYLAATNIQPYSPATNGTVTIDPTLGNVFVINTAGTTGVGTTSHAVTISATPAGHVVYIIVKNNSTSGTTTLDFNAPFYSVSATGPGQYTISNFSGTLKPFVATFVSDGSAYYMVSAAQSVGQ
jgi:hypothetical protein